MRSAGTRVKRKSTIVERLSEWLFRQIVFAYDSDNEMFLLETQKLIGGGRGIYDGKQNVARVLTRSNWP